MRAKQTMRQNAEDRSRYENVVIVELTVAEARRIVTALRDRPRQAFGPFTHEMAQALLETLESSDGAWRQTS